MSEPEQLELELEWPVHDHYKIELIEGAGDAVEVVRSTKATDVDGAIGLIDGFRELAAGRDDVTWDGDNVDERGVLFGLDAKGVTWQITCVPPLSQELG